MQGESKRLISRDVEEGRTTKSEPGRPQKEKSREWPSKLRMLLFCLILIGSAVILTVVVVSLDQRTGILKTRMSYFSGDPPATSAVFESVFPVKHALSDEELLWRASMVPRRLDMPFSGEKRIAFMFLAAGPLPLASIWEKFFEGYERFYSIYIHSHPNHVSEFSSSSVFYGRHVPSKVSSNLLNYQHGSGFLTLFYRFRLFLIIEQAFSIYKPLYNVSFLPQGLLNNEIKLGWQEMI